MLQQRRQLGGWLSQEGQGGLDSGVDLVVAVAQHIGVVGVGAHSLEAVEVEIADADDVRPEFVDAGVYSELRSLCDEFSHGSTGDECRRAAEGFCIGTGCVQIGGLGLLLERLGIGDELDELGGVEVDVGERGEHPVGDLVGVGAVGPAEGAQGGGVLADPQTLGNEHILQRRRVLALTAIALREVASEQQIVAAVGLLTLVTERFASFGFERVVLGRTG